LKNSKSNWKTLKHGVFSRIPGDDKAVSVFWNGEAVIFPFTSVNRTAWRIGWLLLVSIFWSSLPGQEPDQKARAGNTWYVRVDGGTCEECDGLSDAPYPGSGTSQPCAWNHPFCALPPEGPARIAGGDTLIIHSGSYKMGLGASGADVCDASYPWACYMVAVPSGPDSAHPTRILGDCGAPPELWGTERTNMIVNLTGSNNVELECLEITDHSSCVEFHSDETATCERDTYPFGDWAETGLYAEDSSNVLLQDIDIHGLAHTGIMAGRLTDWTMIRVDIIANGWVGWDGDITGIDSNSGTLYFSDCQISWNGCGETWPQRDPVACWAQSAGGYGDGLGTGATTGHWIFENSSFVRNTSDGLDLLYVQVGGSIEIRSVFAEGNAGNQIKTSGPTEISNTIAIGNCSFFDGKPFTYNVDPCRALGNTLSLRFHPGDQVSVLNSTIAGEGDCLAIAVCEGTCDGSESALFTNTVFQGDIDYFQPWEHSCLFFAESFPIDPFSEDYGIINGVKEDPCPGPHDVCNQSAGLVNASLDEFDAHLTEGSPAIDSGLPNALTADFSGTHRPLDGNQDGTATVDRGAYEYISGFINYPAWLTREGDPDFSAPDDKNNDHQIDIRDFVA